MESVEKSGNEGFFIVFCILPFPPESLEGEKNLGEFLKTKILSHVLYIFPLFKNNIYNIRINGKEYTNNTLKKTWDSPWEQKKRGIHNPTF